jgi:hypothetical protein
VQLPPSLTPGPAYHGPAALAGGEIEGSVVTTAIKVVTNPVTMKFREKHFIFTLPMRNYLFGIVKEFVASIAPGSVNGDDFELLCSIESMLS